MMMEYLERVNFHAKFEPEGNYILHGTGQYDIYEQFSSYDRYRQYLPQTPPIMTIAFIGLYDDVRYDLFAALINTHIATYTDNSYVLPQIGVEFCRGELEGSNYEHEIAAGKRDDEIRKFMLALKTIQRPVFIRPGYGFNGEWNGYDPEDYKAAFRRMREIMEEVQCQNVCFVWNYNPAAREKDYMKYYPGDEYVDWWGIDIFQTPEESAPYAYTFLEDAEKRKKPVMLGEATAYRYGTTYEGWQKWFVAYFEYIKKHPVIKAACYVNWDWTQYAKWSNWGDCRIETNEELVALYENELSNPVWLNDTNKQRVQRLLDVEKWGLICEY